MSNEDTEATNESAAVFQNALMPMAFPTLQAGEPPGRSCLGSILEAVVGIVLSSFIIGIGEEVATFLYGQEAVAAGGLIVGATEGIVDGALMMLGDAVMQEAAVQLGFQDHFSFKEALIVGVSMGVAGGIGAYFGQLSTLTSASEKALAKLAFERALIKAGSAAVAAQVTRQLAGLGHFNALDVLSSLAGTAAGFEMNGINNSMVQAGLSSVASSVIGGVITNRGVDIDSLAENAIGSSLGTGICDSFTSKDSGGMSVPGYNNGTGGDTPWYMNPNQPAPYGSASSSSASDSASDNLANEDPHTAKIITDAEVAAQLGLPSSLDISDAQWAGAAAANRNYAGSSINRYGLFSGGDNPAISATNSFDMFAKPSGTLFGESDGLANRFSYVYQPRFSAAGLLSGGQAAAVGGVLFVPLAAELIGVSEAVSVGAARSGMTLFREFNEITASFSPQQQLTKAFEAYNVEGKLELIFADNPNAKDALVRKYAALQGAQQTAVNTEIMSNGNIKYYDSEIPASREGVTRGVSYVTEYNPKTGSVSSSMESYDHSGEVIRIHPKMFNGFILDSVHFPATLKELQVLAESEILNKTFLAYKF